MIEVRDYCCQNDYVKELDLSGYVKLRELMVGNDCFYSVIVASRVLKDY